MTNVVIVGHGRIEPAHHAVAHYRVFPVPPAKIDGSREALRVRRPARLVVCERVEISLQILLVVDVADKAHG